MVSANACGGDGCSAASQRNALARSNPVRVAPDQDTRDPAPWEPRVPLMFKGTAPYYARYRPGYPPELLVRLAAAAGLDGTGRLLDLGCERVPVDALLGRISAGN